MNHCSKIMKAIVLGISLLTVMSLASNSAMGASYPALSNMLPVVDGTSTPVRVIVDQSGNYYVSDPKGGGVLKYSHHGDLLAIYTKVKDAGGLAFSANFATNNELLVTHGETVVRLNTATGNIVGTFGSFKMAQGIAVDAAGYIYVADALDDCVQKFDSSYNPYPVATAVAGHPSNSFGTTGLAAGQMKRPSGLAYEKASNQLAVVDTLNGRVQFFTTAGAWAGSIGTFGSGSVYKTIRFTMPKSIAFEYSGSVVSRYYIADSFQSNVQVIDAATKTFLGYIGQYGYSNGNLVSPSDVIIDQTSSVAPVLLVANEIGLLTRYGIDSLEPTDVKVLPATVAGSLTVTWTNPGVASFSHAHVYRSEIAEPSANSLGVLKGDNITAGTFTDTGLESGKTYYYTVRGVNLSAIETSNTEQASGTTMASYLLTASAAGTGVGSISSNLPLPGLAYSGGVYTATVDSGTQVTLYPTPDTYSLFKGWTGTVCNGQESGNCVFTLDSAETVQANFELQHKFMIAGRGIYEDILQNIYNNSQADDQILAMVGTAPAYDFGQFLNMTAIYNRSVSLIGGYDATYTTSSGYTTIQGTVKVKAGKMVFKNIKIKP